MTSFSSLNSIRQSISIKIIFIFCANGRCLRRSRRHRDKFACCNYIRQITNKAIIPLRTAIWHWNTVANNNVNPHPHHLRRSTECCAVKYNNNRPEYFSIVYIGFGTKLVTICFHITTSFRQSKQLTKSIWVHIGLASAETRIKNAPDQAIKPIRQAMGWHNRLYTHIIN